MHVSLTAVGVLVAGSLLAGCSQPTSPISPTSGPSDQPFISPAAAGKEVPFKGSLEGVVTVTPANPGFISVLIEGAGTATHLGRYTVTIPHLVDLAASTGTGSFAFTAANGDTLTADFTGRATPTASPTAVSIKEEAVVTGGTGRFAGATGSFTVTRQFDFATLLTTGSFEGTISSPGAGTP